MFLAFAVSLSWAQSGPLKVKRMDRQGFTVTKEIEGEDVVLAYSETGNFDKALEKNPVFGRVMEYLAKQTRLRSDRMLMDANLPDRVEPLCTDLWHQFEPYYNLTPITDSIHCATGCVAHAMAEVLYYYKYPEQGTGSYTYFDSVGCKQLLTANFGEHRYDWDYILDVYHEGDYSERQALAVAQLLSDCGISVNMQYTPEASGAEPVYQPQALVNYFGYDRSVRMIYRDFYTRSELHNILKQDLAKGHPILVSGWTPSSGHAFVIDGYDENGLFHILWGLGDGWCDGFYNIDYMSPDQPMWYHDPNSPEGGWNILQCYCVGIQPELETEDIRETFEFAFSHMELLGIEDGRLTVCAHDLSNVGWNIHNGQVGLALKRADGEFVGLMATIDHEFGLEEITDEVYSDTLSFDIPSTLADGNYRVVPVFEHLGGQWKEARTMTGIPNYIYINVSAGKVSQLDINSAFANLSLAELNFPDTIIRGTRPEYSVKIKNESQMEYCGRFYFSLYSDDNPTRNHTFSILGQYIGAGETLSLNFGLTPVNIAEGNYKLRIFYDFDLFTDSLCVLAEDKPVVMANKASAINGISRDEESVGPMFDLSGRRINTLQPNQIIITTDGKKRSIQNVP